MDTPVHQVEIESSENNMSGELPANGATTGNLDFEVLQHQDTPPLASFAFPGKFELIGNSEYPPRSGEEVQSDDDQALDPSGLGMIPEEVFRGRWVTNKKLPKVFNKSNSLVARKYQTSLTVTQQKLINILFHKALVSDSIAGMPTYWATSLKDAFGYVEVNSRNYEKLSKTIKELKNVELNVNLGRGEEVEYNFITVFPTFKIKKGIVAYEINAAILQMLRNKNPYTKILIEEIRPLSMACSVGIYELASRYARMKATPWMHWEELREKIYTGINDLPKNTQTWTKFNKFYVKHAIEDVNANTKYLIELETSKIHRSVNEVRLIINLNATLPEGAKKYQRVGPEKVIGDQLDEWNVDKKSQNKILEKQTIETISLAIEHTRYRIKDLTADPIKNPGSYFFRSLTNKYYETSLIKGFISIPEYTKNQNSDINNNYGKNDNNSINSNLTISEEKKLKFYKAAENIRLGRVKIILNEIDKHELYDLYDEYNDQQPVTLLKMIKETSKNKVGSKIAFQNWYIKKLWGPLTDATVFQELVASDNQNNLF